MAFYSEIRTSQINQLFEKVQKKNYGKYLLKININKARSFQEKSIIFDFPVTAVVGINGGGKTTILGAAACAYKTIKPSLFFAKSGRFDSSMQKWKFEYEVIDKQLKPSDVVKRSATFKESKWSREALDRQVIVFGVSRTVPANERSELKKCSSKSFTIEPDNIVSISSDVVKAVASILDKDISEFNFLRVDNRGKITLLTGQTISGELYS
jgi:predicted ATP-dependent endonuclease of OLD family